MNFYYLPFWLQIDSCLLENIARNLTSQIERVNFYSNITSCVLARSRCNAYNPITGISIYLSPKSTPQSSMNLISKNYYRWIAAKQQFAILIFTSKCTLKCATNISNWWFTDNILFCQSGCFKFILFHTNDTGSVRLWCYNMLNSTFFNLLFIEKEKLN